MSPSSTRDRAEFRPPIDLSARFGQRIRELRRDLALSQEALADLAKLDRTTVGRVERGEFRVTLEVAEAMAQACGTSLWEVLQSDRVTTD